MPDNLFDLRPNLGHETSEPSLREVLKRYYAPYFSISEAEALTGQYIEALRAQASSSPAPAAPVDEIDQGAPPAGSGHPSPTEPLAGLGPAGGAPSREVCAFEIGEETTLAECRVGLFLNEWDNLCLKSEYGSNEGRIDAYIVDGGEFFWGAAPQTIASQRASLVRPVIIRLPAPCDEPPKGEDTQVAEGRSPASAVPEGQAPHPIPSPPVDEGEIGKLVDALVDAARNFGWAAGKEEPLPLDEACALFYAAERAFRDALAAVRDEADANLRSQRYWSAEAARAAQALADMRAALAARETEVAKAAFTAGWLEPINPPTPLEIALKAYLQTLSPGTSAGEAREAV